VRWLLSSFLLYMGRESQSDYHVTGAQRYKVLCKSEELQPAELTDSFQACDCRWIARHV
jgi:hypothetical protein